MPMHALPHLPQRSSPESRKSLALPRRFACSPRSARIACAFAIRRQHLLLE